MPPGSTTPRAPPAEMPKPTRAHRALEMLAGDWLGEEKTHPSPFDSWKGGPRAGSDPSSREFRTLPGGRAWRHSTT